MQEVRCGRCQRKLAMADYVRLEIKCPRCDALNVMRAVPQAVSPQPERQRASEALGGQDGSSAREKSAGVGRRQKPIG